MDRSGLLTCLASGLHCIDRGIHLVVSEPLVVHKEVAWRDSRLCDVSLWVRLIPAYRDTVVADFVMHEELHLTQSVCVVWVCAPVYESVVIETATLVLTHALFRFVHVFDAALVKGLHELGMTLFVPVACDVCPHCLPEPSLPVGFEVLIFCEGMPRLGWHFSRCFLLGTGLVTEARWLEVMECCFHESFVLEEAGLTKHTSGV